MGTSSGYDADCIVIGSGFGGAVTACRLAEAGHDVLVLERGDRYPPGSFPRTPLSTSTNVWDPSQRLYGLFDIWSFRRFEALVASGLGGGSLIYANVLLRRTEEWFRAQRDGTGTESWPVGYDDLVEHYETAEEVLGATPYPYADTTAKTRHLRDAAAGAGLTWLPAPLAVGFSPAGKPMGVEIGDRHDNLHGVVRTTCTLCGQCDVGCNRGSKNSTDLTYLSRAWRHGARIETFHEVRLVRPLHGHGPGYEVTARVHRPPENRWERDAPATPPRTVTFTARTVVLAAGSLGSTYLLLRNRPRLPDLSKRLGTRFSCNGDYLGFVRAPRSTVLDASQAPVITSYVTDTRAAGEGSSAAPVRCFLVEDGGYPVLADWLSESLGVRPVGRVLHAAWTLLRARMLDVPRTEISGTLAAIVGDSRASRSVVPMLGMGRDVPDGTMSLRHGLLDVAWEQRLSDGVFGSIAESMAALAEGLGGRFSEGPSSLLSRVVTVHPLGGAPMGADADHGVVDDHGEVFGYPGLFVADGAVMPGPVGVNPSLTIAALAERFSARLLERNA